MKLRLFFILILVLALVFCGCKRQNMDATVPTQPITELAEPPAPKAGLLLKDMTTDEQDAINLQTALEDIGYEVLLKDAENSQSKQNEQVKQLVSEGCAILVLQPVMTSGLDVLLSETTVPVLILDAEASVPETATVLCAKEEGVGLMQAQLLESLPGGGDLNGDGSVSILLINSPDNQYAATRSKDFVAALNTEKYVILDKTVGDWNENGGKGAVKRLLPVHGPDAEVIVTFGDAMALGAIAGVEDGGWTPGQDFHLVTAGSSTALRNELQLGRITGAAITNNEVRLQLLQQLVTALDAGLETEKVNYYEYIPAITEAVK